MRYETVRMILEIKRRMTDDALYTSHRPATDGDAKRLSTWPSGGIVQLRTGSSWRPFAGKRWPSC